VRPGIHRHATATPSILLCLPLWWAEAEEVDKVHRPPKETPIKHLVCNEKRSDASQSSDHCHLPRFRYQLALINNACAKVSQANVPSKCVALVCQSVAESSYLPVGHEKSCQALQKALLLSVALRVRLHGPNRSRW
jgi:hypothetical protein